MDEEGQDMGQDEQEGTGWDDMGWDGNILVEMGWEGTAWDGRQEAPPVIVGAAKTMVMDNICTESAMDATADGCILS